MKTDFLMSAKIETILFSKESYRLIEKFDCGETIYAKFCMDWLKGVPPDPCAFQSIEKHGSRVWIYQIEDCVFGFGSLGKNGKDAFIPMLAVAKAFQGRELDGKKYSNHILEHLIAEAQKLELKRLCLYVSNENANAKALYKKFGFQEYGGVLNYGNIRMCRSMELPTSPQ
jgi:L-amino acid N-acyltransferase YncA